MSELTKFPKLENLEDEFKNKAQYKRFNGLDVYFIEFSKYPISHRITALDTDVLFQYYVKDSLRTISQNNIKLSCENDKEHLKLAIFTNPSDFINHKELAASYLK